MHSVDHLSDPRQRIDMLALLEGGFFAQPNGVQGPGAAPASRLTFDQFERATGLDEEDLAPFFRQLQADMVQDPALLQQLNDIREQLGLPRVDNANQAGLQDPSALMGEDLMALLVMWALKQQDKPGSGRSHSGLPQQSFRNTQPTSWNPGAGSGSGSGGGGGGGTSGGHNHGGGSSSSTGGGSATPTAIPGGPVPDAPADIGPVVPGQNGVPAGLKENAARGAAMVREVFGFDGTIGGLGQRSNKSDHPYGNAIDVMTNENMALGQQVADFFVKNREDLGVKYVIFNQRIASASNGWQWTPMEDRGSPTANHVDHPHISFHGPE